MLSPLLCCIVYTSLAEAILLSEMLPAQMKILSDLDLSFAHCDVSGHRCSEPLGEIRLNCPSMHLYRVETMLAIQAFSTSNRLNREKFSCGQHFRVVTTLVADQFNFPGGKCS